MGEHWTCPACNAQFAAPNQWHSCLKKDLEAHFQDRPDEFVLIFDEITRLFSRLGEFRIRSVPSTIIFKKRSSFAAIKIQKSAVRIEWMTDRLIEDERIHKTLQTSKYRFAHVVKIQTPEELDRSLQGYLAEAFQLARD